MKMYYDFYLEEHHVTVILLDEAEDFIVKQETFNGYKVENNLQKFKNECDIIVANRFDETLQDVQEKVFTKDIYKRDS